jgi:hypothetical protein
MTGVKAFRYAVLSGYAVAFAWLLAKVAQSAVTRDLTLCAVVSTACHHQSTARRRSASSIMVECTNLASPLPGCSSRHYTDSVSIFLIFMIRKLIVPPVHNTCMHACMLYVQQSIRASAKLSRLKKQTR